MSLKRSASEVIEIFDDDDDNDSEIEFVGYKKPRRTSPSELDGPSDKASISENSRSSEEPPSTQKWKGKGKEINDLTEDGTASTSTESSVHQDEMLAAMVKALREKEGFRMPNAVEEESAAALQDSSYEESDAELARFLAEEEEQQIEEQRLNDEKIARDIELAWQVADKEEEEYRAFIKTVEEQEHGIVFSIAVNADGTLEDGTPAHPDDIQRFEEWRTTFEQSGAKIKKFHWFVNHGLETRFEAARTRLEELERPNDEIKLFHGTSAPNIDLILKGGFKIGGTAGHQVAHGTAYGIGIYLAESAMTSMKYAGDSGKLFACRVLPGAVTGNPMDVNHVPNLGVGSESYESYSGPFDGNTVYVVRHTELVLPCYMIEYEWDGYAPSNIVTSGGAPASFAPFQFNVPSSSVAGPSNPWSFGLPAPQNQTLPSTGIINQNTAMLLPSLRGVALL